MNDIQTRSQPNNRREISVFVTLDFVTLIRN